MGLVQHRPLDPIADLYKRLGELNRLVARLRARGTTIDVESGTGGSAVLSDGDGEIWVDVDDNTLHYRVNGNEYKLTGIIV